MIPCNNCGRMSDSKHYVCPYCGYNKFESRAEYLELNREW